jgi:hypothetical protein
MLELTAAWLPTPAAINELPEPLRKYVQDLETHCDPSGEVQEIALLRENMSALVKLIDGEIPEIHSTVYYQAIKRAADAVKTERKLRVTRRAGDSLRNAVGLLCGALRLGEKGQLCGLKTVDEYRKGVEQAICDWNIAVDPA